VEEESEVDLQVPETRTTIRKRTATTCILNHCHAVGLVGLRGQAFERPPGAIGVAMRVRVAYPMMSREAENIDLMTRAWGEAWDSSTNYSLHLYEVGTPYCSSRKQRGPCTRAFPDQATAKTWVAYRVTEIW